MPSVGHPTIGAAVRDPVCTTVQLAAGTFAESVEVARDLVIAGAGSAASVVAGRLLVSGATSDVTLAGLRVDTTGTGVAGCWPRALEAAGGAEVAAGPGRGRAPHGDGRPPLPAVRRRLRQLRHPGLVSGGAVAPGRRRSISGTDCSSVDTRGALALRSEVRFRIPNDRDDESLNFG